MFSASWTETAKAVRINVVKLLFHAEDSRSFEGCGCRLAVIRRCPVRRLRPRRDSARRRADGVGCCRSGSCKRRIGAGGFGSLSGGREGRPAMTPLQESICPEAFRRRRSIRGILRAEWMQWAPYNNDCPVRGCLRRDVSHALKGGFCPATSGYSRSDRELFGREAYVYAMVVAATDIR